MGGGPSTSSSSRAQTPAPKPKPKRRQSGAFLGAPAANQNLRGQLGNPNSTRGRMLYG